MVTPTIVGGELTLDYATTGTGVADITVRATDSEGLFVEDTFTVTVTEPSPSGGIIRIEAEDYKAGTNGVEYFDSTEGNSGNASEFTDDVDVEITSDTGGGFHIGYITKGEYLTYDVSIPEDGVYDIVFRVATPNTKSSEIEATIGGQSYTVSFSNTGGWQSFQNIVLSNVTLSAGSQELRLESTQFRGFNLNYIEFRPAGAVVNSGPTTSGLADVTVIENAPDTKINLLDIFADLEDGAAALSYNIVSNTDASLVTPTIVGGELTLDYATTGTGVADITVRATDNDGNSAEATFTATVVSPSPDDGVIRINGGGNALYDSSGNLWQADTFFEGGQPFAVADTTPIANTLDDSIYQTQRQGGAFSYQIPVVNGNYNINFHLAELNFNDFNQRLFDVSVEELLIFDDFDIYGEIKNAFLDGKNTAKVIQSPDTDTILVNVTDGSLDLDFTASLDEAVFTGIEIIPIEGAQIFITQSENNTRVEEIGLTDSYSIILNAQPTEDVKIDLQFDITQLDTSASSLIFTPSNWNIPQTIIVNAIDDALTEDTHFESISHTITTLDSAYSALSIPDVQVEIEDNDGNLPPIKWTKNNVQDSNIVLPQLTVGAWGPDGRLYVGSLTGEIRAYTFDDNYDVTTTESINVLTNLPNHEILGIAFNPFDSEPKIYVSHSQLYANNEPGFDSLTDFSPYSGQVSTIEKVNGEWITLPLITGIGVSNHDHGVNALDFDNEGNLLIAVGGNTNAGVADERIGGLDESPFTAAILKAEITKPDFNGQIEYELPPDTPIAPGLSFDPATSQGYGGYAVVKPGIDVLVYASGLRNPFDLVWSTKGFLYATDNGPNANFGDVSTGLDSQVPFEIDVLDETVLVEKDSYYGHPNRNRGRFDARQNVYYAPDEPSIAGVYTAPIAQTEASTTGITEYRATAFGSQLRGDLLVQRWQRNVLRINLSTDGTDALTPPERLFSISDGLDLLTGPGGAVVGIDLVDNEIEIAIPDETLLNPTAYDIFPWRAPYWGGQEFIIGGVNFDPNNTSVLIGGEEATITGVSSNRIKGIFPEQSLLLADSLLDVTVTSGGDITIIQDAFLPLG